MLSDQFQEITINNECYKSVKQIGDGSFGKVYEVVDSKTNHYALKIQPSISEEEHKILQLKHQNIVQTHFVESTKGKTYILMDLCQKDLYQMILEKLVQERDLRYIVYSIAQGLQYLHSNNIIHRDLKPENIFIYILKDNRGKQEQYTYKIGDFGISKQCNNFQTRQVGTLYYMAPELLKDKNICDKSVDIWALGIIMIEILTGELLFNGNSEIEIKKKILSSAENQDWKLILNKIQNPIYKQLISQMLEYDQAKRLTIEQVIQALKREPSKTPPRDTQNDLENPTQFLHKTVPQMLKSGPNFSCSSNTKQLNAIAKQNYSAICQQSKQQQDNKQNNKSNYQAIDMSKFKQNNDNQSDSLSNNYNKQNINTKGNIRYGSPQYQPQQRLQEQQQKNYFQQNSFQQNSTRQCNGSPVSQFNSNLNKNSNQIFIKK